MLADYVRETLETPMDELTEKFAWPTEADARDYAGMSTGDIMGKIKCKLPPYHGRCRTTTIISKKVTVKKSSEGVLSGEPGKSNKFNKVRHKEVSNLSREELKSRVLQQTTNPYWDRDAGNKRLETHIADHGNEFSDFDENYEKISNNVLHSFDNVYTFQEGKRSKWAFYSDKYKALLIVDDRSGQTLTMYQINDIKQHLNSDKARHYLEVL